MREPYFHESPPKSTGEELFGSEIAQKLFSRVKEGDLTLPDLMQTLLSFTVETIALSYEGFIFSKWEVSEIVFSGGGCKNHVLMQKLRDRLKGYECTTTDDYGIPSEAKEAVAFAVLANELVSGNMTNVPGATGASRRVPMGKIVLGR
jgi:anhydro-N-acetylmuramic acid kinase